MLCLDRVEQALIEDKRPYYQNIHKVLNRTPLVRDVIVIITQMVYQSDIDFKLMKFDKQKVNEYNDYSYSKFNDECLWVNMIKNFNNYGFRWVPLSNRLYLQHIYYDVFKGEKGTNQHISMGPSGNSLQKETEYYTKSVSGGLVTVHWKTDKPNVPIFSKSYAKTTTGVLCKHQLA